MDTAYIVEAYLRLFVCGKLVVGWETINRSQGRAGTFERWKDKIVQLRPIYGGTNVKLRNVAHLTLNLNLQPQYTLKKTVPACRIFASVITEYRYSVGDGSET